MTHSPTDILNLNQPPEELSRIYQEDYYDYLSSAAFETFFLSPIASILNNFAGSVIDVGCGEGCIASLLDCSRYLGIDGSSVAIERAKQGSFSYANFTVARIEDYQPQEQFDCVLFGGIMEVLVAPEHRLPLAQRYINACHSSKLLIYDLDRLDLTPFDDAFTKDCEVRISIGEHVESVIEPKRNRKFALYSC